MAFDESAGPQADLTVVADRPFLWAIVHQETGALLFIGCLVDSTALAGPSSIITSPRARPGISEAWWSGGVGSYHVSHGSSHGHL